MTLKAVFFIVILDKSTAMKKYVILAFFGVLSLTIEAQIVGSTFPDMEVETIDDKVVTLPKDVSDKYTLVGLAYSKKSEQDLDTWLIPIYNTFIYKPEKPSLFSSFAYDINVYFIPMFTGVNAAAKGTGKNMAVKNMDPKLHPNVLFFKGQLKPYKDTLGFDKKDVPYFFVIDTDGKIVYATSGAYSQAKMDELTSALD